MSRRNLNLFSSLKVRIIFLIFISMAFATFLTYKSSQKDRKREIEQAVIDFEKIAYVIVKQEEDLLDGTRQLLITLSDTYFSSDFEIPKCNILLRNLMEDFHRYLNLGFADLEGNVLCSALPMEKEINIADRLYFQLTIRGKDFSIGEYQIGKITKQSSINFGYPVIRQPGQIKGVLFAAFDLNVLSEFEQQVESRIKEGSVLTKIDRNGIVLARSPSSTDLIGKLAPEENIIPTILKNGHGTQEWINSENQKWIIVYSKIPSKVYGSEIYMYLKIPEEVLFQDINHIFTINLLLIFITTIILSILTWFLTDKLIVDQIKSVEKSSQELAAGNLSNRVSIPKYATSEIINLILSFNQMADSLEKNKQEIENAYNAILEGWGDALNLKDKETEGHSVRVSDMTVKLAEYLGLDRDTIVYIKQGALLHDIGKIGIPDKILLKVGSLTNEEWEIMKMHPIYAKQILSRINFLQKAIDIPYSHHEKWDGSGYPQGLKREKIPIGARIFAVIDSWDALTSDRPYRKAWPRKKALEYIRDNSGIQFDPNVVDAFLKMINIQ